MDFIAAYPKIEPKPNARLIARALTEALLLLACAATGIVNLCIGGNPWSLYVLGGALVFWVLFLYHPLVEFSLLHRVSAVMPTVCAYVFLVDLLTESPGFSGLVVPIILFSVFFMSASLFFLRFKRQKHNVFPIFVSALLILALIILAACGVYTLTFNWPMIVLCALDGAFLILSIVFFSAPLRREFKKKFHTR